MSYLANMNGTATREETSPTIVESYRDYIPSPTFRRLLQNLLNAVPPRYFVGLKTIILTNQAGETCDRKRQKVWSRNHKIKLVDAQGYYSPATRTSQASIVLHVDNILNGMRPWELKAPLLCYEPLATVLYHEIGHHIHAEHKPLYKGKEDVADDWSKKLSGRFYRQHYWYLMPLFYPLWFFIKAWKWLSKRFHSSWASARS
jgi:hypothetical protein